MDTPRLTARPWPIVLGSAAALLLFAGWCARTPAIEVEAASAQRAALRVEVNTNGKVEPVPEAEVRVHARLDGRIVELPEPGTEVQAGDVILHIDEGPAAAALAAAESEHLAALESLRAARNKFELLSRRADTDAELFQQGALTKQRHAESQASLEETRSQLANLEREVPLRAASLELRITELRAQQEAAKVRAPFAGTIYRTEFKEGASVRVGEPILWLADLTRLRVRANVDQVDLGRVRVGQSVRISANAYPERSWKAVVAEIVPHVVEKDNRAVSESLALVEPPTEGLVPGMTVDLDIVVEEVADTLQVPATAIHASGGASYVFRVAEGRARRTPIVLGRASVNTVEIVSGLEPDDQVVLGSSNGLDDGSRVDVRIRDVSAR